nr:uncharacterized protein LOC111429415 [Onthophagus taurus]
MNRWNNNPEEILTKKVSKMSNSSTFNILDLNNYILLEILGFLNATDLWLLSKTCGRLNDLIEKECFWRYIDARDSPNTVEKIEYCAQKCNQATRDVRICADGRHLVIISSTFFRYLNRASITILALENQKICGNDIQLKHFPENLMELSLKKTYITEINEFLTYYDHQLKKLKVKYLLVSKMSNSSTFNILDLNNYILLEILGFLNATDLWLLSKTCGRLNDLIEKECFWRYIDARDSPNTVEKIEYCAQKCNQATRDVRICADGRHLVIISSTFFRYLNRASITILALENQKICGNDIQLKHFPENLMELSLKKTYITEINEFLTYYDHQLKKLKVLILDQCCWVNGKILHRFGDLKSLEIISLYKCKGLYDVELGMIQTFNQLRIADCRFSGLGNFFLQSLARKPKVQEIYFQNYLTTYFVEKNARDMEIKNSKSKNFKYSYITENDDIPLWNETALHKFVGSTSTTEKVPYGHLTETSTELYATANPIDENYNFHSLLYQRPYEKCTCQNNPDLTLKK